MIKILTFNIRNNWAVKDGRNWWGFRRRAVLRSIDDSTADLVALQEVRLTQLRFLKRHLRNYRFVSGGRTDGRWRGEHCTVLVNARRFEVIDWRVRWFSPTPTVPGSRDKDASHPRIATYVRLEERRKGVLLLVNVHLDSRSSEARRRAVDALVEEVRHAEIPVVIVGDFNCGIDDPVLQPMWEIGFKDALADLPARGEGAATAHGFTGTTEGMRIDHVLVSASTRVVAARIDAGRPMSRLASDHWPVFAELELAQDPEASDGTDIR